MAKQLINPASLMILGLLLAACSDKDAAAVQGTVVTRNDFESIQGWNGTDDATISSERAHSGKYAVRVGPANEFGYTYIRSLGKMSIAKVKAVTVSAWVWVPSAQATSSLVVEITHSPEINKPVFYGRMPLVDAVKKFKEWQQVSQTFTLPDSVQTTNQFKCYLWRAGATENVYADDITISISN
ncbi:carbohydrate binding domain-containing protein [Hymenobacter rubidus]|uniref:carbohydrate binding domain-containing protein n=1 Tax=Hymenobacter rubidus TaxID=1441626 RepID=UPI00192033EE|nr:carbohydrate binding domain-containing protein [Hymenobacter rubidus]